MELKETCIVARNVKVVGRTHFGRQRPFPLIGERVSKRPVFEKRADHLTCAVKRGLFFEGQDFRVGLYIGDVYEVKTASYFLFRVTDEPHRIIMLPSLHASTRTMLVQVITSCHVCNVDVSRKGKPDKDIQELKDRIVRLKGCFQEGNYTDKATAQVENYVRAYYLKKKLRCMPPL